MRPCLCIYGLVRVCKNFRYNNTLFSARSAVSTDEPLPQTTRRERRHYRLNELSVEWNINGYPYVLITTICACTSALDCGYINHYVSLCQPTVRGGNPHLLRFLHKRYFLYFSTLRLSEKQIAYIFFLSTLPSQNSHRDLRAARPRCNMLRIYPSFGSVACSHVSSVNRHRKFRYYGVIIRVCAACTSRGRIKIWGALISIFLGLRNLLLTKNWRF